MTSEHKELSDQDELIADLLGQGWTHRSVADSVGVSSKTCRVHLFVQCPDLELHGAPACGYDHR